MKRDRHTYREAHLSSCSRYRWTLTRRWGSGPCMGFVMLNPSTADAEQDDPTIRRCIGFAEREGCGSLLVANLFAFRATDRADLRPHVLLSPLGPEPSPDEIGAWRSVLQQCSPIVAAWGVPPLWLRQAIDRRAAKFQAMALDERRKVSTLGVTKHGYPPHPVRLRRDAAPVPCTWGDS